MRGRTPVRKRAVSSEALTAKWNSQPTERALTRQKAGGKRNWRFFRSENWVKQRRLKSGRREHCRFPKCESPLPLLKPVIASEVGGLSGVGGSGFWTLTFPCGPVEPVENLIEQPDGMIVRNLFFEADWYLDFVTVTCRYSSCRFQMRSLVCTSVSCVFAWGH